MAHVLTVHERPGYVHFVVTGINSRETVQAYLAEIGRECAARGCRRILIEERLEGPRLNIVEVFGVVTGGGAGVAKAFDAIAFVDVYAQGGLMKFAEDVAVNRAVPMKLFDSVAEAEAWLRALV